MSRATSRVRTAARASAPGSLHRPSQGASVAPDGSAVAHIVDDGGYPRAVQRFLDGMRVSAARDVTLPVEGPITRVVHSPDGRWLACQVAPHAGNRSQVWVVTTDPEDRRAIWVDGSDAGTAELVGWDGPLVAVTVEGEDGVGEARLVHPVTGRVEVLARRPGLRLVDAWSGTAVVRLGPRGDRRLILLRGGREIPLFRDDPGSTGDPAIILDDHRPRTLLGGRRYAPATEVPDALQGYVRVLVRTDHGADRLRLVQATVTPEGVSHRVVAARGDADLDEFIVSDDLSRVALLWNVGGGRSELQVVEFTDGTLGDPVPLPEAVASDLSLSADGRLLALTSSGIGRARCVELVAPTSGEWVALERPPAETGPVHPSLLTLRARDGLELSGWLYRPADRTDHTDRAELGRPDLPDEPGPMLIWLHGGPEGQSRPEHSDILPTILAAGYPVFAPNVRGSGGFGRAFSHADDVDNRMRSIEDVEDVVAHLVARGLADPARVVCSGRSYGGYLTNAMLAFRPGLFAGGISICGMSDLLAFYAETEPWIAAAAVSKYGDPDRDAELLTAVSPIHRVADIDVPMLVVHGGNDTNVPVGESRRMVEALRAAGGQADLLIVEGEGHDFTRPENRALLANRMRDFVREVVGPA